MEPHCANCKHWGASSEWNLKYYPWRAAYRDCDHPARKAVGTGYDQMGSDLSCSPIFGCNQFEEKQ